MGRKLAALQRRIARVFAGWKDPHDRRPYPELDIVQRLEIKEDGEIALTIKPSRPHCPCCLLDIDALRKRLCEVKGVTFVHVEIVDIPAAGLWTRSINR